MVHPARIQYGISLLKVSIGNNFGRNLNLIRDQLFNLMQHCYSYILSSLGTFFYSYLSTCLIHDCICTTCSWCPYMFNIWPLQTDVRGELNATTVHAACQGGNKEIIQYVVEELKCNIGELIFQGNCHCKYINGCQVYIDCEQGVSQMMEQKAYYDTFLIPSLPEICFECIISTIKNKLMEHFQSSCAEEVWHTSASRLKCLVTQHAVSGAWA